MAASADIIVLALLASVVAKVNEFLCLHLILCFLKNAYWSTTSSDRPALEEVKAAFTATTIAEFFRDQGKNVLLMMDSCNSLCPSRA